MLGAMSLGSIKDNIHSMPQKFPSPFYQPRFATVWRVATGLV